jgi:hypothetical protein
MKNTIQIFVFTVVALFASLCLKPSIANAYTFSSDLRIGSSGEGVIALQDKLIELGFKIPAIQNQGVPKGYFGGQTLSAVIQYQRSKGLPATGFVGPLTRGKLNTDDNTVSLKLLSPNGGEEWAASSTKRISWRIDGGKSQNNKVDIYLDKYTVIYCIKAPCPGRYDPTYTLDKGISGDFAYNWIVGTDIDNRPIQKGTYSMKVCLAGTEKCDQSDFYFIVN